MNFMLMDFFHNKNKNLHKKVCVDGWRGKCPRGLEGPSSQGERPAGPQAEELAQHPASPAEPAAFPRSTEITPPTGGAAGP